MWRLYLLIGCLPGCALGAGPWQPGRDAWAVAGSTGNGLNSTDEERRAEHQEAKGKLVPEIGGGTTTGYYMDGSFYAGIKQGVSWTRPEGGEWSDGQFIMDIWAGFAVDVLDDHAIVGGNLFAVGYGSGDDSGSAPVTYIPFGGELVLKLPVYSGLAVHASGGLTYGNVDREGAMKAAAAAGVRVIAGIDWPIWRVWACDIVLSIDAQEVRTESATVDGVPTKVQARAVTFELVLAAF